MKYNNEDFDVQKFLIAQGLDACRRSYRESKNEECYNLFMSFPITKIMGFWKYLSDEVKGDYVKKNIEVFFRLAEDKVNNEVQ